MRIDFTDYQTFINMEIHYTERVHIAFIKHLLTWATGTTRIDPSINRNLFTRIFYNFKFFAGIWFLILFNHDNIVITAITSIDVRVFINMEIHYTGRVHIAFIKHLLTWATGTTQIDPSINRNLFRRIF